VGPSGAPTAHETRASALETPASTLLKGSLAARSTVKITCDRSMQQYPLEPLLPGGRGRDARRSTVNPAGDRCFPSDPSHSLEDHGCRPRSPPELNKLVSSLSPAA
jgi:hypothetical protein